MHKKYFQELIQIIKDKHPNKEKLSKIKTRLCKKHNLRNIPTDIQVLLNAPIKEINKIKKLLLTKPVRTISGVSVIALMTKPFPCPHGKCVFCPGGPRSFFGTVPQSYTGKEPSTRRSIRNKYDPYLTVMNRLEQYIVTGHVPEKVELIIQGGTFPAYPKKYQEEFVKGCYLAMNDFSKLFFAGSKFNFYKFKKYFLLPGDISDKKRLKNIHSKLLKQKKSNTQSLKDVQKSNEKSRIKCVGLTVETRPDWGTEKEGNFLLNLGCTRIELGIQTIYNNILKKVERGHTVKDNIKSIQILKDLGFKLNYHIMPGLPGVTKKMDLNAFKTYFSNPDYRPDMLKIYPCMVLKGTKLFNLWKKKKFTPLNLKQAAELIVEMKKSVPRYCRIMRVQRDIPTEMTEAGVERTNLRQYVQKRMKEKGMECQCIRCREPKGSQIDVKGVNYSIIQYQASGGKEFFIEASHYDNILGFCRLRFPSQQLRKEITKDSAIIRELHVYGVEVAIGEKGIIQHKGIGKKLLKIAEEIAEKHNKNKIVVISAVGVRDYFKKLGYRLEVPYMTKEQKI